MRFRPPFTSLLVLGTSRTQCLWCFSKCPPQLSSPYLWNCGTLRRFGNLPGSSTAEMVVNFLVSLCENPLFRSKFSEGLFKAAQDCIVNMLSVDWRLSNTGLVSQVIFRISQMLDDALPARGKKYDMHDPGEGVACSVACNLIRLLSRISVHLNVASVEWHT